MNLAQTIDLYCYGTSEGAKKAWDSIGRKGSAIAIAKKSKQLSVPGMLQFPVKPSKGSKVPSVADRLRSNISFSVIEPFSEKGIPTGPIVIAPSGEIFSVTAHFDAANTIDPKNTYSTTYKVLEKNDVARGVINSNSLNLEIFAKPTRAQVDNMVSLAESLNRRVYVDIGSRDSYTLRQNVAVDNEDVEKVSGILNGI